MNASSARLLKLTMLLSACGQTGSGNAVEASPTGAASTAILATPTTAATPPSHPASPSAASDTALAKSHATIVAELNRLLVGKATLDGATVSAIQTVDACSTALTTAKGVTVVEWSKAGNIAPHDEAGREINDLPSADDTHALSVPVGDVADGVSGAVGLLASECAG